MSRRVVIFFWARLRTHGQPLCTPVTETFAVQRPNDKSDHRTDCEPNPSASPTPVAHALFVPSSLVLHPCTADVSGSNTASAPDGITTGCSASVTDGVSDYRADSNLDGISTFSLGVSRQFSTCHPHRNTQRDPNCDTDGITQRDTDCFATVGAVPRCS